MHARTFPTPSSLHNVESQAVGLVLFIRSGKNPMPRLEKLSNPEDIRSLNANLCLIFYLILTSSF
ncbi:hypothetical protein Pan97_28150 [Bremerella volcania]|uniref:Uncharacterized protein n=1 Tax=Bremerella volcania TaxID=2527984 RepID=A0A518C973_9BACT|nr:hypothetical protein Pan97_28150 [Bremerella volcania]